MSGVPAPSHVVEVFSRGRWFVFTTYRTAHSSTPGACTAREENLLFCRAVRAASASLCGRLQSGQRYVVHTLAWCDVKTIAGPGPCFPLMIDHRREMCFLRGFLYLLLKVYESFPTLKCVKTTRPVLYLLSCVLTLSNLCIFFHVRHFFMWNCLIQCFHGVWSPVPSADNSGPSKKNSLTIEGILTCRSWLQWLQWWWTLTIFCHCFDLETPGKIKYYIYCDEAVWMPKTKLYSVAQEYRIESV